MIQLNDKIRIVRLDSNNVQIEEYRKVIHPSTKEERYNWVGNGYYGSFSSAISGVLRKYTTSLTEEDIKGCNAILERIEEIRNELMNAIKEK